MMKSPSSVFQNWSRSRSLSIALFNPNNGHDIEQIVSTICVGGEPICVSRLGSDLELTAIRRVGGQSDSACPASAMVVWRVSCTFETFWTCTDRHLDAVHTVHSASIHISGFGRSRVIN